MAGILLYVTNTDVQNWMGSTPANVASLIRQASLMIREATRFCWYATDPVTLFPTDANILQAFKDACCAQIEFWVANNLDPVAILNPGNAVATKKIGTAEIQYQNQGSGSVAGYERRVAAANTLCDQALRILSDSNLQLSGVWVIG